MSFPCLTPVTEVSIFPPVNEVSVGGRPPQAGRGVLGKSGEAGRCAPGGRNSYRSWGRKHD